VKRGLVVLDPAEIPPGELDRRVGELQRHLRRQRIAAALIYADVYHSGDITYLTNICVYWNEALLAVPASGRPALLSKISRRVHPWMRATSNLEDLRSGPNLADLVRQYAGELGPGAIGLAEMDWWPAQVVEDIEAALPGRDLEDLGGVVRRRRRAPSAPETALLRRAAELTGQAVTTALDGPFTNPERAGRAELTARLGGAEDVSVYCHPSTAGAATIEVVSEYRGYWTSAARVVSNGDAPWAAPMDDAYRAGVWALGTGVTGEQVRAAVDGALAPTGLGWRVDLIDHTDLETDGGYRSAAGIGEPLADASVFALRLELDLPDGSSAVLADTFEVDGGTARCLTRNGHDANPE
jgi:hypothetical protein